MDMAMLLALVAVLSSWVVWTIAVRRWGPGRATRRVRCPQWSVRAKVVVEQQEGDFGSLRVTDVAACSLFPRAPLDCGKECMQRL